jgi:hypothetical protein
LVLIELAHAAREERMQEATAARLRARARCENRLLGRPGRAARAWAAFWAPREIDVARSGGGDTRSAGVAICADSSEPDASRPGGAYRLPSATEFDHVAGRTCSLERSGIEKRRPRAAASMAAIDITRSPEVEWLGLVRCHGGASRWLRGNAQSRP